MRAAPFAAAACVVLSGAQILFPGASSYHTAWYALILGTAIAVSIRAIPSAGVAARLVVAASAIVGFAGLASGLLGPDNATYAAAPNAVVSVPALGGSVEFPAWESAGSHAGFRLVFHRRGAPGALLDTVRYSGSTVSQVQFSPAALLDVSDVRGDHLTITQPVNSTFLSPVLLFPDSATIAGQRLAVDSFSVPALHRIVHAVYFRAEQLRAGRSRGAAVLFSESGEHGAAIPTAALAHSGEIVQLGELRIRCALADYPRLLVASAPDSRALALGLLCFLAGAAISLKTQYRSKRRTPES